MKEKLIEALTEPLKEINVSIYDISFEKEDNVDTLFIKLDSEEVMSTDLCAKAANIINPIIDELNLDELSGTYELDVCSKGESNEQ